MSAETIESAAADAVAAPLDLLLTDAALGGRGDDFGGHTPDFSGSPEGCRS